MLILCAYTGRIQFISGNSHMIFRQLMQTLSTVEMLAVTVMTLANQNALMGLTVTGIFRKWDPIK